MITASSARRLSEKSYDESSSTTIVLINSYVREVAKRGQYSIKIYIPLNEEETNFLIEMGYSVIKENEMTTVISW